VIGTIETLEMVLTWGLAADNVQTIVPNSILPGHAIKTDAVNPYRIVGSSLARERLPSSTTVLLKTVWMLRCWKSESNASLLVC
jgi:hypothetical protein